MPTYVSLLHCTQKGIEEMKERPARLDKARELFKQNGGELQAYYLAMGQYDAVVISKSPDGETAAKLSLTSSAGRAIRTETFRVFTEDEYRKIISKLP